MDNLQFFIIIQTINQKLQNIVHLPLAERQRLFDTDVAPLMDRYNQLIIQRNFNVIPYNIANERAML